MSKLLGSWKKILWLQQIDRILWCCNENQCKKDVSHEEFPASSEARMFRVDVAIYAVKNEQSDFFPPCRKRCSLQNAFNRIYSISYAVYSVIITIIVHSGAVGFCMRMFELEYFSFWARDIQGKKKHRQHNNDNKWHFPLFNPQTICIIYLRIGLWDKTLKQTKRQTHSMSSRMNAFGNMCVYM